MVARQGQVLPRKVLRIKAKRRRIQRILLLHLKNIKSVILKGSSLIMSIGLTFDLSQRMALVRKKQMKKVRCSLAG